MSAEYYMTNRNNFSVYLRESEQAKLAVLMEATDLSRSGVLRKLIAEARVVRVQSTTVPPVSLSRETPQERKARMSESRRHKKAQQDARRDSARLAKQAGLLGR